MSVDIDKYRALCRDTPDECLSLPFMEALDELKQLRAELLVKDAYGENQRNMVDIEQCRKEVLATACLKTPNCSACLYELERLRAAHAELTEAAWRVLRQVGGLPHSTNKLGCECNVMQALLAKQESKQGGKQ